MKDTVLMRTYCFHVGIALTFYSTRYLALLTIAVFIYSLLLAKLVDS